MCILNIACTRTLLLLDTIFQDPIYEHDPFVGRSIFTEFADLIEQTNFSRLIEIRLYCLFKIIDVYDSNLRY